MLEYFNPICNQSLIALLISIYVIIKLLINKKYTDTFVIVISTMFLVIILNCLCRCGWPMLAWIYSAIAILQLLVLNKLIDLE